ncbi:MAG: nuclear transport factor 2 family protein [Candidatus Aminicenantes bacterium]|nr:nuclear transport factor 2 family protein [Candidatus Aminicenantes bacterium]
MELTQKTVKIISILFFLVWIGCRANPDLDTLHSEILDFHKKFIADHLNKDLDSFLQDYSDDYIFVAHGEIRHRSKEEMKTTLGDYFKNTTFTEYKDVSEPIIGVSDDGSTAWSIVKVRVAGSRKLDDGTVRDFDTTFAWITVYKRKDGKWTRQVEVSTDKPTSPY